MHTKPTKILAIDPGTREIGVAVLEGEALVYYGIKTIRNRKRPQQVLQEAARIVRDAEGRAELLMEKTQARMDDVQRDIDALRMKRREAESNLESLVAAIRNTITSIHEQEQRDLPKAVGHHLQVVR